MDGWMGAWMAKEWKLCFTRVSSICSSGQPHHVSLSSRYFVLKGPKELEKRLKTQSTGPRSDKSRVITLVKMGEMIS